MPPARRVPPITQKSFTHRYMIMWSILGAAAAITGLIFGPQLHRWSHGNDWICITIVAALYAGSVLLCPVVLMSVWRRPAVTPPILFFAIPIGAVGLGLVFAMRSIGPSFLYVARAHQYGLYTAVSLLYAASLVWAVAVGMARKAMGEFDLPDYR